MLAKKFFVRILSAGISKLPNPMFLPWPPERVHSKYSIVQTNGTPNGARYAMFIARPPTPVINEWFTFDAHKLTTSPPFAITHTISIHMEKLHFSNRRWKWRGEMKKKKRVKRNPQKRQKREFIWTIGEKRKKIYITVIYMGNDFNQYPDIWCPAKLKKMCKEKGGWRRRTVTERGEDGGGENPFITHISSHRALFISRRPETRMSKNGTCSIWRNRCRKVKCNRLIRKWVGKVRVVWGWWRSMWHASPFTKLREIGKLCSGCVQLWWQATSHSENERKRRRTQKRKVLLEMTEHFEVTAISKNHRDEPLQHRLCI